LDEAARLLAACPHQGADYEAVALERTLLDAQRGSLTPDGQELLLRRVERRHPETPQILEALALGAVYTQRLGEAMAWLERWLAYAPGDSQALYLRGLVREGMGDLKQAGDDYRRAVRHDPEHTPARLRLAEYLIYAGEYREAAELFEGLLAQQPHDAVLLLGLARCRRLQGEIAEAERLLDELLARDCPPSAALVERAGLAQDKREFDAAEIWFRQALARDPFDRDACHGLGQCLRALGRASEAESYEARRAQIDRDLETLAQLCEQMGKNPDDADLPYQAGMICLRNGQQAEARRWFRNVLQRRPQHDGALRGLQMAIQQ
jgi:tetratricopeptide (TPR) repeat protein